MAEATIGAQPARQATRFFYVWMALACIAVAFIGFLPTYFMPLAQGRFSMPPVVHVHGWLFFAWTIFFATQSWLVASGRTVAHREWGLLGVSLATAMVFAVFAAAIAMIQARSAAGFRDAALAFAWVQVGGVVAFFAPVVTLAILNVRKPDVHKRLMLLATISLLDAPIARWFMVALAPPGMNPLTPPPVAMTVPPAFVADLLLLAAIAFDWRTRGKPHAVYLIGGAALLALQLTREPISETPLWMAIAAGIAGILG